MPEALKNIKERNSCRDFADTPLTEQQVKSLVEAALQAPSARNIQPWHVTCITDKSFIDEMDAEGLALLKAAEDQTAYNTIMSRGGKMLYNAPCYFVISANDSMYAQIDSGILCQNIAIAAEALGLGSCIIGMIRTPLSGPRGAEFIKRMQFPEGYNFAISILVGHVNTGKPPHDMDFSKVTHIN